MHLKHLQLQTYFAVHAARSSGFSGNSDIFASSAIATFLYPFGVFAPEPTAVPPSATFCNSFWAETISFRAFVIDVTYAANSLP